MSLTQTIIETLGSWSWVVLGLILLGLEILAPGTIFLWFGLSAIVVGIIALAFGLSWQVHVVLFVVLSLVSLFIGRKMMARTSAETGDPGLNKRGSRYVGREFTLTTPLNEGAGNLSIDDTIWRISGPDLPAGTKVRVDAVEGARLIVSEAGKGAPA